MSPRGTGAGGAADDHALATTWQVGVVAARVPRPPTCVGRLPMLAEAVADALPVQVGVTARGDTSSTLAAHRRSASSQRDYVDTFDSAASAATCYLTYFPHGDTRKRGVALVRIKQRYRRAGAELADGELPDYLLRRAGVRRPVRPRRRLAGSSASTGSGLEMLRLGLRPATSRWAARRSTRCGRGSPPLDGDEGEALTPPRGRGPPQEEVGQARRMPWIPAQPAAGRTARRAGGPGSGRWTVNVFWWVIVPYVCLAVFVARALLALPLRQVRLDHPVLPALRGPAARMGSPLFHFGLLGVIVGHVVGLLVPQSWTDAVGISETTLPRRRARPAGSLTGLMHRRRDGNPHLPPADGRAGLLAPPP